MSYMNRYNLHIQSLTCEKIIELISKCDYHDVCETIKQFNITGKDLIELKEFDIRLKVGNKVDKKKLQRLISLIRDVQATPQQYFPIDWSIKKKTPSFLSTCSECSFKYDDKDKSTVKPTPIAKPERKSKIYSAQEGVSLKLRELREKFNNFDMNMNRHEQQRLRIPSDGYVVLNDSEAVSIANCKLTDEEYDVAPVYKTDQTSSQGGVIKDVNAESILAKTQVINQEFVQNEQLAEKADYLDLPLLRNYHPPQIPPSADDYLQPIAPKSEQLHLLQHKHFRNVNRQEGKRLLAQTKKGSFLLRPTSETNYLGVLMINGISKMQNVLIFFNKDHRMFHCETELNGKPMMFNDLDELLEYYTHNDINGDVLLKGDVNRLAMPEKRVNVQIS